MREASQAKEFFQRWGFVVFTEVISELENSVVRQALVADLHEINPATNHITDVGDFTEDDIPTSPNNCFRTTCNIVFGRFAQMIRESDGVRNAFATLHDVSPDKLGCSWDTIFYTPAARAVDREMAIQPHWDANGYCAGKVNALAEELCVQGVYYSTATSPKTPSFICSPGSQEIWPKFSESSENPSKSGSPLLNYMPLSAFSEEFVNASGLPDVVRVEVPERSLLLWNSRTCHGNSPAVELGDEKFVVGRVSLPVCYGPVAYRTVQVQTDALLRAIGGIRTTHHSSLMSDHTKQGYPVDWTAEAEAEPNSKLRNLNIKINGEVTEAEFQQMIQEASLSDAAKRSLATRVSISNVQQMLYRSYWRRGGLSEDDVYAPMLKLKLSHLRRLVHPQYSRVQGLHPVELA